MVIDMRTRLPHGHLANHAADMAHHARQVAHAAKALSEVTGMLEGLLREIQAFRQAG